MSNTFAFTFEGTSLSILGDVFNPLFIVQQICTVLGFSNSRKAVLDHCDPEDVCKVEVQTNGGKQLVNCINESGLYALIFGSKLPKAKQFKRWVTGEVLPAIRKQGAYVSDKLTYEEALKIVESRNATLTPTQQYAIKSAVAARAQKEPAKYKEIYSALKRRFQVARYDQIMKEDYEEALTFIREMQLAAQLPARPKQNEAEPVAVNDQEVRYELGMTRAEIESFGQFIYCWKYLFRPSLVTFRELLSAVHSPLAGNLYDATFDTTLNRLEEVFRKHGIPVGPERLSGVIPYYP
ncbi:BRO family protein [uncultured Parasutterella sp.]|uniref:BRO family protein n=3 Tax=uncultured Parasutterella sp. TaxID=1263098 RepID=UPI00272C6CF7|nr:BRO family protein [uncultured Parasutterella sp.]